MQFSELAADPMLSCDEIPRQFVNAIAWILANDMELEGPFRLSASVEEKRRQRVMAENGFMPMYSSNVPEALLKEWLQRMHGAIIVYDNKKWTIRNPKNIRYELAMKLNKEARMTSAQLKVFALMVAVSHCIVRHQAKTKFDSLSTVATVIAQNLFVFDRDSEPEIKVINDTFTAILEATVKPEQFREMFYSIFPGANPPEDITITKARPVAATPIRNSPLSRSSRINIFQTISRLSVSRASVLSVQPNAVKTAQPTVVVKTAQPAGSAAKPTVAVRVRQPRQPQAQQPPQLPPSPHLQHKSPKDKSPATPSKVNEGDDDDNNGC